MIRRPKRGVWYRIKSTNCPNEKRTENYLTNETRFCKNGKHVTISSLIGCERALVFKLLLA